MINPQPIRHLYEVKAVLPDLGKVKHMIRAKDEESALERAKRAHPKCTPVDAVLFRAGKPNKAAPPVRKKSLRESAADRLYDAMPSRWATYQELCNIGGGSREAVRGWVNVLVEQGRAEVEVIPGNARNTKRIRKIASGAQKGVDAPRRVA